MRYFCEMCPKSCGQPYTLTEHYREKHNKNITSANAINAGREVTNEIKVPKFPKRVHEIIECKCKAECRGTYSCKRHVEDIHNSTKYSAFDKNNKLNKYEPGVKKF